MTCAALGIAACGDEGGAESTPAKAVEEPITVTQTARSGSFLERGGKLELILRGVGGTSAIGVDGAVATAKLVRETPALLGPEPISATLSGAEVNPQRYRLRLSEASYDGRFETLTYRAEIDAGQPERPQASFGASTLTLESNLAPAGVGGVVRSADGTPLAGALISAQLSGLDLFTALSDDSGRFQLGPIPPGNYHLEASLGGFERDSTQVAVPAEQEPAFELVPIPSGG